MRYYHELLADYLTRYHTADPFAVDYDSGEVLSEDELRRLADTAAEWAYKASISGGRWDGRARIVNRRRSLGGIYAEVLTVAPSIPCGLPTICLFCPAFVPL